MYAKSISLKSSLKISLKDALKISSFIFLLAISSKIRVYIPYSPVPITLQTLIVFLSVVFLGSKGIYAQAGWIFLGLIGIPVFSKGGGFLYFLGPTGGYILGFLLASLVLLNILDLRKGLGWYIFCFYLASLVIYALGVIGLMLSAKVSFPTAFALGVMPFIYGNFLKVILASLITRLIKS